MSAIWPGKRFIPGEPMKVATNRLDGCRRASGRIQLLQHAAAHDRDAVAHGHRLDLVVGDVDRRRPELALELSISARICDAQLGVEVRKRLVHQEDLGSRTIARPIATRWRWPPESCPACA